MIHINFIHITSITSDIKGYIIDIDLNEFRAWKENAVMNFIL